MSEMLEFLRLHTMQAHAGVTQPGTPSSRPTTKVDKRPRPTIQEDMSEHDWWIYLAEWKDYAGATSISDQNRLDELSPACPQTCVDKCLTRVGKMNGIPR